MAHVVRCQPATIPELKQLAEGFASNFDPGMAGCMAKNMQYRPELCMSQAGGHFEGLIKKRHLRGLIIEMSIYDHHFLRFRAANCEI